MHKFGIALAVAAMIVGPMATAQTASAGQNSHDSSVYTQPAAPKAAAPKAPDVQLLDCVGGTGRLGCGPGWFWRDGWRGLSCYPC